MATGRQLKEAPEQIKQKIGYYQQKLSNLRNGGGRSQWSVKGSQSVRRNIRGPTFEGAKEGGALNIIDSREFLD